MSDIEARLLVRAVLRYVRPTNFRTRGSPAIRGASFQLALPDWEARVENSRHGFRSMSESW